jgi:hypothetical protein
MLSLIKQDRQSYDWTKYIATSYRWYNIFSHTLVAVNLLDHLRSILVPEPVNSLGGSGGPDPSPSIENVINRPGFGTRRGSMPPE